MKSIYAVSDTQAISIACETRSIASKISYSDLNPHAKRHLDLWNMFGLEVLGAVHRLMGYPLG